MVKIYGLGGDTNISGGGLDANYRFSSNTAEVEPTSGHLAFNNATITAVTKIFISKVDSAGLDRSAILQLRSNDAVSVQSTQHSAVKGFKLTAAPIDNTTWITLPVEFVLGDGVFSNNEQVVLSAIFSGASTFLDLTDTPNDYTGHAGKLLAVDSGELGVEPRNIVSSDLGSGTADNTTYLRGDLTWATVASDSGVTVQADAPTGTTNAPLGTQIYSTVEDKYYICIDATTDNNIWKVFHPDNSILPGKQYPYPGGTLTNGIGADTEPNKVIADTDIIYAFGTNFGIDPFTNPVDGVRITQTNSGIYTGGGDPSFLTDRVLPTNYSQEYHSTNIPNSWFTLTFNTNVTITDIAIQHRGYYLDNCARTIDIQTFDTVDTVWTTQTTIAATGTLADWELFTITGVTGVSTIRFTQTSPDSSGAAHYLILSEILLWGSVDV